MKKLYEKNQLTFAIVWIVIYCVLQSLANPLNKKMGTGYSASAIFCVLQTAVLFAFMRKNSLWKRYGLCKASASARQFLYFVPLILLATVNLRNGAALNYSLADTACRIVCMLCVGFLEEVIYRGIHIKAMAQDHVKSAIIVSSITFGMGHVLNLFNGSGMKLGDNFIQIIFATAVGFLFVTIFYYSGSLLPCIFTHAAINTLNTFANEGAYTVEKQIIQSLVLIVLTVAYTLVLTKTLPENPCPNARGRKSYPNDDFLPLA